MLLVANIVLALGWLFSLIPQRLLETAILGVIAYTIILALFIAVSKGVRHEK